MRNAHEKYKCYPSVICVGVETEITVFPRDISRRFRDDIEYEMAVRGADWDELDYHCSLTYPHPFRIENGCMKFTYTFETEQEYVIRFREKGGTLIKIPVYAVEEDLYELRPLKGDLHTHSYYSDGEDGFAMTPADYREQGFDFFSLTDHNRMYPSVLAAELYRDIPLGMNIIRGEEVHTPGSQLHIVHVGGKDSICNKYIHDRENFELEVDALEREMTHVPQQYRRRTAMAKWVCNQAHEAGGIAIFAHPYWRPRNYNISKEFADILFAEKMFDAFELIGGITSRLNNLQVSLWQEQMVKGNPIPVVGSTDSHSHNFAKGKFGKRFTYVFAKSNKTEDVLEGIRRGYTVAAEVAKDNEEDVQFYSTQHRLVLFAHFLYDNYFDEICRLSFGEGILMRRYAEGEPVKDKLAMFADTIEDFYKKFYGLAEAPKLPKSHLALLDNALDMQRNVGPMTKGSGLEIYGTNQRRE